MALRFRRSIRLAPGIRLNVGKRGVSLSAGVRGASVTVGHRGTYTNVGIPGTGLSVRKRIGSGSGAHSSRRTRVTELDTPATVRIQVEEDGALQYFDDDRRPLSDAQIKQVKRMRRDQIEDWLTQRCNELNATLTTMENLYEETPSPDRVPIYNPIPFDIAEPSPPRHRRIGLLGFLFPWIGHRREAENAQRNVAFKQEHHDWEQAREQFNKNQYYRKMLLETRLYQEPEAMSEVFEEMLQNIDWPRETLVSFDIAPDGKRLFLDVDLPEIEDMPDTQAIAVLRGLKINFKSLTDTKVRQLYMQHIHGIGFRLIGEAFASLPTVNSLILHAYSQRPDKATGAIQDEYLYSVQVNRDEWSVIRFDNLEAVDVVESLAQFDLRRSMSKTGVFKPVSPHPVND